MKNKILLVELAVAIALGAVTAIAMQFFIKAAPSEVFAVRVGVEDYVPFIGVNRSGQLIGISATILQKIALEQNLNLVHTGPKQLTSLLKLLAEGKIDVVTSVKKTDERAKTALYTKPYITVHSTLISASTSPKTVCTGRGFAIEDWIRANRPDLTIKLADSDVECIAKMTDSKVDSVALDDISLSSQQTPQVWIKTALPYSYDLSFAVSKHKPKLFELLNSSIPEQLP